MVSLLILASLLGTGGPPGGFWFRPPEGRGKEASAPLQGAPCEALQSGERVTALGERSGAVSSSALAYRDPTTGGVMIPANRIGPTFVDNPLGIYWDSGSRTATILGPADVLSIHFPEGKEEATAAILNGERVDLQAILCSDGFYLPLEVLAEVLQLQAEWPSEEALRLRSR